jgi:hypothetical protein
MIECKHEWYVFSAFQQDRSLMVECRKCKAFGVAEAPTKQEWHNAVNAQEPYLWKDSSRVTVWPGDH